MTHTIRLRGPWQCMPIDNAHCEDHWQPVSMPGSWQVALPTYHEAVRLKRHFNRPPGLAGEQVEVVLSQASAPVRIALNQTWLSDQPNEDFPHRYDVTALLEPHNTLLIETEATELGLVTLELS